MNSKTGEIVDLKTLMGMDEAKRKDFDIALTDRQAAILRKLEPSERVQTVAAIRAACGSACPSIKDRFKKRTKKGPRHA